MAAFRPDLYDAALGKAARPAPPPLEALAAFAGPAFDPADITGYLASFAVAKRA
jgi:NitT/TauT family transport system ATP-binding protein